MRDLTTIRAAHEKLLDARLASVASQLEQAPAWVRKNLYDDQRLSPPELLRQAQWHERTAMNHQIVASGLRLLLDARERGDAERLAELAKLFDVYPTVQPELENTP